MAAAYLLPCSCGKRIAITGAQAGTSVRCKCGRTVEVPTIRGIQRLKPAEVPEDDTSGAAWTLSKAIALLAGIVLVAALGGIITLTVIKHQKTAQAEQIADQQDNRIHDYFLHPGRHQAMRGNISAANPAAAWQIWQTFKTGIDHPLPPDEKKAFEKLESLRAQAQAVDDSYNFWIWALAGVGLIAGVALAVSLQRVYARGRHRSRKTAAAG